jgi:hypothetical protein
MSYDDLQCKFNKAKSILTDPEKLQHFMKRNRKELMYWVFLMVGIVVIYSLFSEGDFSFLLTLSGIIQMFGFFIIAMSCYTNRSVSGLSKQTILCYAISFAAKCISILFYEGYLPYDSSGDFIYRLVEVLALGIAILVYTFVSGKFKGTYNWDLDNINAIVLIVPTLILSIFVHPSLNNNFLADSAWTFALYLESIAMFPQLYLFSKKGGEIETFTSHFVASQALSRFFAFVFWIFSYHELNEPHAKSWSMMPGYCGYFVLLFQLVQLILLGDFMYYYVRSLKRGVPMTLPSSLV